MIKTADVAIIGAGHPAAPNPRFDSRVSELKEEPETHIDGNVDSARPPDDVLQFTRGKRAVVVAGPGHQAEKQDAIFRALKFRAVAWEPYDPNLDYQFMYLVNRIREKQYDVVIYVLNRNTQDAKFVIRACKNSATHFVFSPDGFGIPAIAHAIQEHLLQRRATS